jgi:hypothetical protein
MERNVAIGIQKNKLAVEKIVLVCIVIGHRIVVVVKNVAGIICALIAPRLVVKRTTSAATDNLVAM